MSQNFINFIRGSAYKNNPLLSHKREFSSTSKLDNRVQRDKLHDSNRSLESEHFDGLDHHSILDSSFSSDQVVTNDQTTDVVKSTTAKPTTTSVRIKKVDSSQRKLLLDEWRQKKKQKKTQALVKPVFKVHHVDTKLLSMPPKIPRSSTFNFQMNTATTKNTGSSNNNFLKMSRSTSSVGEAGSKRPVVIVRATSRTETRAKEERGGSPTLKELAGQLVEISNKIYSEVVIDRSNEKNEERAPTLKQLDDPPKITITSSPGALESTATSETESEPWRLSVKRLTNLFEMMSFSKK